MMKIFAALIFAAACFQALALGEVIGVHTPLQGIIGSLIIPILGAAAALVWKMKDEG